MTRATRITFTAAGIAAAAIAALAVVPFLGTEDVASAVPEPVITVTSAPVTTPSAADPAEAYAAGVVAYDTYLLEGRLLLPPGYAWLAGADQHVTRDAAQATAWYDWIAAHADAALNGDQRAGGDLRQQIADAPTTGELRDEVVGLAQGGAESYAALREMFPLPEGMKFSTFRADRGPSEYASGTAEVNADGLFVSYTVAPGDTLYGIAQRFTVRQIDLNRTIGWDLQPGDVVALR